MKERFDGAPIGLRVKVRDQRIIRQLAGTLAPGAALSKSDVVRFCMRVGFRHLGFVVDDDPSNGAFIDGRAPR